MSDAGWKIDIAVRQSELMTVYDMWTRFGRSHIKVERIAKPKLLAAVNDFKDMYMDYCKLNPVGAVLWPTGDVAAAVLDNYTNSAKQKAIVDFVEEAKYVIELMRTDRITMNKFDRLLHTGMQGRSDKLLSDMCKYAYNALKNGGYLD